MLQALAFCNGALELKKHELPDKNSSFGYGFAMRSNGSRQAILTVALWLNANLFHTDLPEPNTKTQLSLASAAADVFFSLLWMALLNIGLEALPAIHHADYHIAIVVFSGVFTINTIPLFLVEAIAVHGAHLLNRAIYSLFQLHT